MPIYTKEMLTVLKNFIVTLSNHFKSKYSALKLSLAFTDHGEIESFAAALWGQMYTVIVIHNSVQNLTSVFR